MYGRRRNGVFFCEKERGMSFILEEASRIVTEREHAYQLLTIDLSFMAVLSADHQAANQIWEDAVVRDSAALLEALGQARQQALVLTRHTRWERWRHPARYRLSHCQGPRHQRNHTNQA